MKKLLLLLILSLTSNLSFSQDFKLPTNLEKFSVDSCTKYNPELFKSVDWVINSPLDEKPELRTKIYQFIFAWCNSSKDVDIVIVPSNFNYLEGMPDFLIIYMGGWSKKALETNDKKNITACSLAGFESVIKFYENNKKQLKKNKKIEELISMQKKGKLEEYNTELMTQI